MLSQFIKQQILLATGTILSLSLIGVTAEQSRAKSIIMDVNHPSYSQLSEPQLIAQSIDLSGRWQCNDRGVYYIRQIGNEIWWYGQSVDNGLTWSNVFHGYINGDEIVGTWADVPRGSVRSNGEMTLKIVSPRQIQAVQKTGGFGGSNWTR
jgi:hypothetical protein